MGVRDPFEEDHTNTHLGCELCDRKLKRRNSQLQTWCDSSIIACDVQGIRRFYSGLLNWI